MEIDFTQLMVTLAFLAGPAGAAAWMVFLSNAIRNLREIDPNETNPYKKGLAGLIQQMSPFALQTFVTVLSLGVPALATVILAVVPVEVLEQLQAFYGPAAALFIIYLGQQIWFQVTKGKPAAPAASVVTETSPDGAQKTTAQAGGTIADPKVSLA
jgi:hypothetical protein